MTHQNFERLSKPLLLGSSNHLTEASKLKSGKIPKLRMRRALGTRSDDAGATCGKSSPSGSATCPLNVCCSSSGYCGTGSDFCSLGHSATSCQEDYGSCRMISRSSSSCGADSAMGRSIGYFQLDSVQARECGNIRPDTIGVDGLTHLFLAFAGVDSMSFAVSALDPAHELLYREFTALGSSKKFETWIALGGWAFTDPGPTEKTWSKLASCPDNRKKFITSLKQFLAKYGFKGVDIDWEYPGAPERNGDPRDTQNFVALLREMHAEIGQEYGISVALPASYWYLRWFDLRAMEEYVDFFGLMTYDLHGTWDSEGDFGNVIAGHTDIAEVQNMILPLWYAGVDPAKINFGLAYYGRGYTLSNPSCHAVGCSWKGPSDEGPCSKTKGVMTLHEIENLILHTRLRPQLLQKEMMKELTFNNQWIGYDDADTIKMKKKWASQYCFGGTMIWSVDQYSSSREGGASSNPEGHSYLKSTGITTAKKSLVNPPTGVYSTRIASTLQSRPRGSMGTSIVNPGGTKGAAVRNSAPTGQEQTVTITITLTAPTIAATKTDSKILLGTTAPAPTVNVGNGSDPGAPEPCTGSESYPVSATRAIDGKIVPGNR
ncbi:hypothetical protein AJ80_09396 [Polytolypa hystricis UAMH7299]|uniref:chitinase n=1 Tax=Polytolypa hystricis (strain UAMH7299) TaxID=1447883 RepID=A0A2B7WR88_POLH7|nr:hypothetical protein AJ80_09396 [Polytolypa hystricis UAMH7299]